MGDAERLACLLYLVGGNSDKRCPWCIDNEVMAAPESTKFKLGVLAL